MLVQVVVNTCTNLRSRRSAADRLCMMVVLLAVLLRIARLFHLAAACAAYCFVLPGRDAP
jgi:hypothetical protein